MPGPGRAGILFDVDGTLVDTNYLHTLAWSRAFRDAGEWVPMNSIHRRVGMGGDQLIPELLGHDCPQVAAARTDRYKELIAEAEVFPGAAELLRRCHELGLVVVLATSAPADEPDRKPTCLSLSNRSVASSTRSTRQAAKASPGSGSCRSATTPTATPPSNEHPSYSVGLAAAGKSTPSCPGTAAFEAASAPVRPDDIADAIPCGDSVDAVVTAVNRFAEAAFTHVALCQIGGDHQAKFIDWWRWELGPALVD